MNEKLLKIIEKNMSVKKTTDSIKNKFFSDVKFFMDKTDNIEGLLSFPDLGNYLHMYDLFQMLVSSAAKHNNIDWLKTVYTHPHFKSIDTKCFILGDAFTTFARNNNLEALKYINKSEPLFIKSSVNKHTILPESINNKKFNAEAIFFICRIYDKDRLKEMIDNSEMFLMGRINFNSIKEVKDILEVFYEKSVLVDKIKNPNKKIKQKIL